MTLRRVGHGRDDFVKRSIQSAVGIHENEATVCGRWLLLAQSSFGVGFCRLISNHKRSGQLGSLLSGAFSQCVELRSIFTF